MAGPHLELFKFGLYVFFPIVMMFHFGNPEWYNEHVAPLREKFWPAPEMTNKPPQTSSALKEEIERLRAEHRAKRILSEARAAAERNEHPDTSKVV